MQQWQKEIKALEEDLEQLKIKLTHAHFTHSNEHDYDIKSKIIEKQNQLIEILIRENQKHLKGQ